MLLPQSTIKMSLTELRNALKRAGKDVDNIKVDPIPIYDSYAFNYVAAGPPVLIGAPAGDIEFFAGQPQMNWTTAAGANVATNKGYAYNNLSSTTGQAMPPQNAYAAVGIFFQIRPYMGPEFENWFLYECNPTVAIQIGDSTIDRFRAHLCHQYNYRPSAGGAIASGAAGAGVVQLPYHIAAESFSPAALWAHPIPIVPQGKLKITMSFNNTGSPTISVINPALIAAAVQTVSAQRLSGAVGTVNAPITLSVGFVGLLAYLK